MHKFNIKKKTLQKYKDVLTSVIFNYEKKNGLKKTKILDVETGNSWFLNMLPSYIKVGIDSHELQHFIDTNFERFFQSKESCFTYSYAKIIPFHDAVFDFVVSNMQERIRILRKSDRLVIMDSNLINFLAFLTLVFTNYITSINKEIKIGGFSWLLNRDVPFYEFAPKKGRKHLVCWKDKNIHSKYWEIPPIQSFSFL